MKSFALIAAFAFAIPLWLLVVGGVRVYSFWRGSTPSIGIVFAVRERDGIDDDAYPRQTLLCLSLVCSRWRRAYDS